MHLDDFDYKFSRVLLKGFFFFLSGLWMRRYRHYCFVWILNFPFTLVDITSSPLMPAKIENYLMRKRSFNKHNSFKHAKLSLPQWGRQLASDAHYTQSLVEMKERIKFWKWNFVLFLGHRSLKLINFSYDMINVARIIQKKVCQITFSQKMDTKINE